MAVAVVLAYGHTRRMDPAGNQYAFVIQTRDSFDRSWAWVLDHEAADDAVAGSGVEDDASGSPLSFGCAIFEAYLDQLVATAPGAVDYYLFEDEGDTEWRILVWDVPGTEYSWYSTVPPPGDPLRRGYARAMAAERIEPQSISTWLGSEVRRRLHDKQRAAQKDDGTGLGAVP
ncbi:hypothetical protein SMD20_31715 [Nonomuraea sp. LP-02]|uniref:hypothetical protein n=1 Tax=Nonomuraea sp. LP-02 TaxID=3097960 RepID=UPI002E307FAD|nr:hypothetical protein [Nonomuraea sp. LP-02]MED7928854.1 hypothetical protein [Nonomuraea sp. LP-02]